MIYVVCHAWYDEHDVHSILSRDKPKDMDKLFKQFLKRYKLKSDWNVGSYSAKKYDIEHNKREKAIRTAIKSLKFDKHRLITSIMDLFEFWLINHQGFVKIGPDKVITSNLITDNASFINEKELRKKK